MQEKIYKLLRWSEHYTKTDMLYLAKGGFVLTIGQFITAAFGLLLAVAFANLLSPTTYGTYKFVLALAGIVGAFSLTGMGTSIIQAVSKGFDSVLLSAPKKVFLWNLGASALSLGVAGYYFVNENLILAASFLIVATLSPIHKSFLLFDAFLQGKKDFVRSTKYGIAMDGIPVLVMVTTAYFFPNPIAVILAFFGANAVTSFLLYLRTKRLVSKEEEYIEETTAYAKHLSVMNVIGTVASQLDKVLLFHFLGAIPLAIYSFAITPPKEAGIISRVIQTLALPKIGARTLKDLGKSLPFKALLMFAASGVVAVAYVFAAPYIFQYLFPQYLDSILYSQVFAATLLFSPSVLFVQALIAHKKKRSLYIINTAGPITRITLLFLLLPLYGIWGAIAAILITQTARMILSVSMFYVEAMQEVQVSQTPE